MLWALGVCHNGGVEKFSGRRPQGCGAFNNLTDLLNLIHPVFIADRVNFLYFGGVYLFMERTLCPHQSFQPVGTARLWNS